METISREFRVALPWELLYADDLAVIAETEEELIKRLNEWKHSVESKGMRVNMNKTKVMISGERQMVWQKATRWTDICNTRCSMLSRFSHFHVSQFPPCKLVPQIHVSHFPPLQHGAAFSCPASSCLAFSASP